MQRAPGEGDPYSVVVQERPGFGSNAVPDPLLSGQRPTGFYLGGGLAIAAAAGIAYAGRQVGGLPAVGCYVVAGLSGLYGGYVVLLGGGWQVLSKVLTRASTRAMCRKASERGQRVLELRSRGDFSDSSVGRVMDQINAGLDGTGSCDAVESTGDLYRFFIQGKDLTAMVETLRTVTFQPQLSASYLWIPEPAEPRTGTRLGL